MVVEKPFKISELATCVYALTLALNFCSLTNSQKLSFNCSLFVNTSFDTN